MVTYTRTCHAYILPRDGDLHHVAQYFLPSDGDLRTNNVTHLSCLVMETYTRIIPNIPLTKWWWLRHEPCRTLFSQRDGDLHTNFVLDSSNQRTVTYTRTISDTYLITWWWLTQKLWHIHSSSTWWWLRHESCHIQIFLTRDGDLHRTYVIRSS